ncbi:hypothetical protein SO3561_02904 [Streptomyces olivochromogenes]|uniref:Uncharacterized protein n=1 Tax=Streptomyces olivochromogenes TaxID=1963 RepID=A0A250VBE3_STROL|nr:hypothetical protein SO3561_02904 [Streptomyces olivochromogenes]
MFTVSDRRVILAGRARTAEPHNVTVPRPSWGTPTARAPEKRARAGVLPETTRTYRVCWAGTPREIGSSSAGVVAAATAAPVSVASISRTFVS